MFGTVNSTEDDRLALRFERTLAHPPARVWRTLTERDELLAWFPAAVTFDLTPGAEIKFDMTDEAKKRLGLEDGTDTVTKGQMTVVEPPRLLEYTWSGEVLRWELSDDGHGGCRLLFTYTFDSRKQAPDLGAGWQAALEVVEARLDGKEITWSSWERAIELRDDYVAAVGG
ncbi:SRPBCC family protein [Amycolatopsis vastitatis]|uniref:SRPBCC family protein n=1 Tax=Amycolatopsis vastitatis TaxID=1905142 RepID=UPI00196B1847|nr:SRPBCC family protein [Amycolatopsis vastitatis]